MIPLQQSAGGVSLTVKVHPRARKNGITGSVGEALKVALTAPPLEERANRALIEFFAHLFEIPRSSVTIAIGQASRTKIVRLNGISIDQVRRALAAAGVD